MNVFNRVFIVLLLLALAVAAVAIIVLAWSAPHDSLNSLRDAVDWLDRNNKDFEKSLLTVGCIAVALFCLILIVVELMPRYGPDVKVTDLQIGDAVLSTSSIGQRVEEGVRQVEHVSDVRAVIRARRNGVDLFMDLHVDPDANLAEVTDAACEAARDILNQRVHVALAHLPRARLHYRELRLSRNGAPQPQAEAQPAALPAPAAAPEEEAVGPAEAPSAIVPAEPEPKPEPAAEEKQPAAESDTETKSE